MRAKDVVVAFISSKTGKMGLADILIDEKHLEFKRTGLKVASVLKLDKIATISKELIIGEIGEAGVKLRNEINHKIVELYHL